MTEILDLTAQEQRDIFGSKDHYVRKIEKDLDVAVIARDGVIKVTGDEPNVRKAVGIIENLAGLSRAGGEIEDQSVDYAIEMKDEPESGKLTNSLLSADGVYVVFCVSPDAKAAENAYHTFVRNAVYGTEG